MSMSTYPDLLAAVAAYTDRDDLAAVFPTFCTKVEATLNRRLDDPDQDVIIDLVAAGEYTALPTDFGRMISISTGDGILLSDGPVVYAATDSAITGYPRHYSIVDGAIVFSPRNSTAAIKMVYRRTIPALTVAAPTNWLMTRAPDVYFNGVMFEEAIWERDTSAAQGFKALFDEGVQELMTDAQNRRWGAGPLAPRIRRL